MNPTDTSQSLKQRLLLAISAGALLATPGCGGTTSPEPDESPSPSSGGTAATSGDGAGGAGGTGVGGTGVGGTGVGGTGVGGTGVGGTESGTTSGGTGGEHSYDCEPGFLTEFCLSQQQMEAQARDGLEETPMDPPRSDAEIAGGYEENGCMRPDWVGTSCCNPGLEPGHVVGDECCYVACDSVCCGRPLVLRGQAITASAASRSDWVAAKLGTLGDARKTSMARELAELWQADALAEHASVASFARFTLQLLALGAPSELVRDAQLAALDEVDHARRCFGIASRLCERSIGPGQLPDASASLATDLAEVVVATIHEGCIGETLAAALASEQARVAEDPEVRESLLKIAEDEARHAELAWRFVAWAVQRADSRVRGLAHNAFSQALARRQWPVDSARLSIDRASLHAWGQLSPEEATAVAQRTLTSVVSPVAQRLLACGDPGETAHARPRHA